MTNLLSLLGWISLVLQLCLILSGVEGGCENSTTYLITAFSDTWHYFYTPNYPNKYESGTDICWMIRTIEDNKVIQLDTYRFELQYSPQDCHSGDFVDVSDGSHPGARALGTLCGTVARNITGTSHFMFIHFHTDPDPETTFSGFTMRYRAVSPNRTQTLPTEPAPSPPDWATDSGCSSIVYIEVTSIVEDFTSKGYPLMYPSNQDRCWQIHSPANFQVRINILFVGLETQSDCTKGDFLEVRDGASLSDERLALLCGDISGLQLSGERYLLVRFKTNDADNRHMGFKIAYWGEYTGSKGGLSTSVRIIISCIAISFLLTLFLTLKRKKGYFSQRGTVNVSAHHTAQGRHRTLLNGPGRVRGEQCTAVSRPPEETGFAASSQPAYPHNGFYPPTSTNLLSYAPTAPPYTPNVYPPPPEYTPGPEDDPMYPAEFMMFPAGGYPISALSPPPPYEERPGDKLTVPNGAPASHSPRIHRNHAENIPSKSTRTEPNERYTETDPDEQERY